MSVEKHSFYFPEFIEFTLSAFDHSGIPADILTKPYGLWRLLQKELEC